MRELTARKARFLWKILVEDNETVVGIEISYGTTGMGGSNTSGDLADHVERYSLEKLRRMKPICLWQDQELCAVIGDQFYLRSRQKGTVKAYGKSGKYILGDTVACDTCQYQKIQLIYREEDKI